MRKILIVIAVLIIGIGSVIIIRLKSDDTHLEDTIDNINQIDEEDKSGRISEEEKNEIIHEIKDALKDTTDKTVLEVNGEKITERELAYKNYQLNNSSLNEGEQKEPIDEMITEYVICQDAKQQGITIKEKEMEDIRKVVKDDNDVKNLAEALNMTYDEVREMYMNGRVRIELRMKWTSKVLEKINEGTLNFGNELFNEKCKKYNESTDITIRTQLLTELVDMYKEYLVSQANIEKIN